MGRRRAGSAEAAPVRLQHVERLRAAGLAEGQYRGVGDVALIRIEETGDELHALRRRQRQQAVKHSPITSASASPASSLTRSGARLLGAPPNKPARRAPPMRAAGDPSISRSAASVSASRCARAHEPQPHVPRGPRRRRRAWG